MQTPQRSGNLFRLAVAPTALVSAAPPEARWWFYRTGGRAWWRHCFDLRRRNHRLGNDQRERHGGRERHRKQYGCWRGWWRRRHHPEFPAAHHLHWRSEHRRRRWRNMRQLLGLRTRRRWWCRLGRSVQRMGETVMADDGIVRIGTSVDVSSLRSGMDQAASVVQSSARSMSSAMEQARAA